jgi:hypothetical protein
MKEWRRTDSFHTTKPIQNQTYSNILNQTSNVKQMNAPMVINHGHLSRAPDTNRKKRDEAADFFAQEKLLIEYWVSFEG